MDLFVSDLDGTLTGPDSSISDETISVINRLINSGILFTVATARSLVSAGGIIQSLDLRLPVVLINGILVFDPVSGKNIVENFMNANSAVKVINEYEKGGVSPWVFARDKSSTDRIYYKCAGNECQQSFIEERVKVGDRRFARVIEYPDMESIDILHINTIAEKDRTEKIFRKLSAYSGISCHYYEDVYRRGTFLLETSDYKATKRSGAMFVKKYTKADRLVVFGDNLNDLSMFEAADEKYAVSNAHPLVKVKADKVIDNTDYNGVARFLQERFRRQGVSLPAKDL